MPASSRIRRGRTGTHPDARPQPRAVRKDRARPAHGHRSCRPPARRFQRPGSAVRRDPTLQARGHDDRQTATPRRQAPRTRTATQLHPRGLHGLWHLIHPAPPDFELWETPCIAEKGTLPFRKLIHRLTYSISTLRFSIWLYSPYRMRGRYKGREFYLPNGTERLRLLGFW
jgi:hypothetical protein